jgi:hypothetical protein
MAHADFTSKTDDTDKSQFHALFADTRPFVKDWQFVKRTRQVSLLYDFVLGEIDRNSEATSAEISHKVSLLKRFSYSRRGRPASSEEWKLLEQCILELNLMVSSDLRKKYRLNYFPDSMQIFTIWALVVSLLSLVSAVYPQALADLSLGITNNILALLGGGPTTINREQTLAAVRLLCFLTWLMSLGSLGSVAFVSVNALSIQTDATFDVTNRRFVFLRILIGALFSLMIALPLSLPEFVQFCTTLQTRIAGGLITPIATPPTEAPSNALQITEVTMLLLPFLLGFSTSVVLMVMNRIMEGVQSFLGIQKPK